MNAVGRRKARKPKPIPAPQAQPTPPPPTEPPLDAVREQWHEIDDYEDGENAHDIINGDRD